MNAFDVELRRLVEQWLEDGADWRSMAADLKEMAAQLKSPAQRAALLGRHR